MVVHPDQVFQRGVYGRSRLTLQGVVVRYIMVSGVIVVTLSALTVLGIALLGH